MASELGPQRISAAAHSSILSPQTRAEHLRRLRNGHFDVVVIGGGITGVGAALDAASRGLSAALIERTDFAAGTSSKSSKLIHGGLRYLEHLDIKLVFEALHERSAMLEHVAPGVVQPVPFVIPLTEPVWQRMYIGAGVALYDALASFGGHNPLPLHRHLSRRGVRRRMPAFDTRVVRGGIIMWDAQLDDARHTMLVARTAAMHGATIVTGVTVDAMLRDAPAGHVGDAAAPVCGVTVRDDETGARFAVRARAVVNATGVWSDSIEAMAGDDTLDVRAAKGIHLVVAKDRIDAEMGMLLRTEKSVLFIIPWQGRWLIGTTDTPWTGPVDSPVATAADIDYVLERANSVLRRPLTHDDILGVFAGLRPLVDLQAERRRVRAHKSSANRPGTDTTAISREHVVRSVVPGLVSIAGGKYTTYRRMAADVIDATGLTTTPSRTNALRIVGADRAHAMNAPAATWPELSPEQFERLAKRHGPLVAELRAIVDAERDNTLARPLAAAPEVLRVEVIHAVTHEGARHLDDVLARRTRLAITTADRATGAAPEVAALMAPLLGWDPTTEAREIDGYRAAVDAERAAAYESTDAMALAHLNQPANTLS